jgi:translation elongation factor EF-Tu-like GTPase
MNKAGEFSIVDSFQLTGRGLVAIGKILEGRIITGQQISIDIESEIFLLKISGVDIGKPKDDGDYFIGLHLRNDDPNINIDLKTVKLKEQIAEIFE